MDVSVSPNVEDASVSLNVVDVIVSLNVFTKFASGLCTLFEKPSVDHLWC